MLLPEYCGLACVFYSSPCCSWVPALGLGHCSRASSEPRCLPVRVSAPPTLPGAPTLPTLSSLPPLLGDSTWDVGCTGKCPLMELDNPQEDPVVVTSLRSSPLPLDSLCPPSFHIGTGLFLSTISPPGLSFCSPDPRSQHCRHHKNGGFQRLQNTSTLQAPTEHMEKLRLKQGQWQSSWKPSSPVLSPQLRLLVSRPPGIC